MNKPFPVLPPLKEVIKNHGLLAKKSLGQSFLMNPTVTDYIAGAAGNLESGTVVEIGPGPGGLTRSLLKAGATNLVAIEKDQRCVAALQALQSAFPDQLTVTEQDALTFDYRLLEPQPMTVVANLPYNIATPLLLGWLKLIATKALPIAGMTLMFQREVGQRITATPGSKSYGRLSILCQWLCETYSVCELPPSAFTPPPKVHSTVVGFKPRALPVFEAGLESVETVTGAAFGQRRKMLRQSLKKLDVEVDKLFDQTGLAGDRRPEELSIEEFGSLAKAYEILRT